MSQAERLYRLKHLLDSGRPVTQQQLLREFGISAATLKRDFAHLRDRMNAPLVFDRDLGAYRLDPAQALPGTQYELPGLWFSADEIHALLTMQHLLANLDAGGFLGRHIEPLKKRLAKLLGKGIERSADIGRRVRVQTVGARRVDLPHFQTIGSALLQRRRLVIAYHSRGRNAETDREISPQRLIHYRDNWYLDAWCHWREALRSFSVDAISRADALDTATLDIPDDELDEVLGIGYGIFAGKQVRWATLRFSPERSRWVAAETWHREQRGRFDRERRWVLSLPFTDPRELAMDVLRHVPEVDVLAPEDLLSEVRDRMARALEVMGQAATGQTISTARAHRVTQ